VVADHLRGQLLGGVGYRGAVVSGQLGADNHGGVPLILSPEEALADPRSEKSEILASEELVVRLAERANYN
jgi:hypothetical protein